MFNISCVERMVITISTEQKPKEIILRSKGNKCFHNSNINDSIFGSTRDEKLHFLFLVFGSDYQKFYDFYQNQKVNNINHKYDKSNYS